MKETRGCPDLPAPKWSEILRYSVTARGTLGISPPACDFQRFSVFRARRGTAGQIWTGGVQLCPLPPGGAGRVGHPLSRSARPFRDARETRKTAGNRTRGAKSQGYPLRSPNIEEFRSISERADLDTPWFPSKSFDFLPKLSTYREFLK